MAVSFQQKVKIVLRLLQNPQELSALLSLKHSGYLQEWGWFNAFNQKSSIGKDNEPLPWVTYPFISFIQPRLKKDFLLFEYGSGNSTLFYSRYVKKITAAEHSSEWYERISAKAPANAEIIYNSVSENYSRTINKTDEKYDIIIVDAIERVECIFESVAHLTSGGVIILDDSDREEYFPGKDYLVTKDFKYIDFWGISPGYLNNKCTTVFYRTFNCLGI
jgi:hypothetical protein